MIEPAVSRFFLGANSCRGFASLYEEFTDAANGAFVHIIKGGPGCGKSTLMARIGAAAEGAGEPVEYIHCSGDPASLDGVRLPERRVLWVDGTAPHVVEAAIPGAAADYLDMSRFLDTGALRPLLPELQALNRRYKARYTLAYRRLAAAAALRPRNLADLYSEEDQAQARRRARALARSLPALPKEGRVRRRFLSAVSCLGKLRFEETLAFYDRCVLPDNALGLGWHYLDELAKACLARGYDPILCPDPLDPEVLEAVLLPEAGLAALCVSDAEGRHSHLDLSALRSLPRETRQALRELEKESDALLRSAVDNLSEAKALHDELEGLYRGHVDFSGADALAEELLRTLFA